MSERKNNIEKIKEGLERFKENIKKLRADALHEDRDGYTIKETYAYVKTEDGEEVPAPSKIVSVLKDGEPIEATSVSARYRVVLFKDLEKIAKEILKQKGIEVVGEPERIEVNELLIHTNEDLDKETKISVGIRNSYDRTESIAYTLHAREGDKYYPVGIITKRKHYGAVDGDKKILKELLSEIDKRIDLIRTLWNAEVNFNDLKIWDKVKLARTKPVVENGVEKKVIIYEYPLLQLKEFLKKRYPDGKIPFKKLWRELWNYQENDKRIGVKRQVIDHMHREIEPLLKVFKKAKINTLNI